LIVYFDTSALVPIVIDEDTSTAATRLWDEADRVISSRLVYAEARAALGLACRIGRLDETRLRSAVRGLEDLVSHLDVVEVTDQVVRRAGTLVESLSLRGYDAIHVASAELLDDADLVVAAGDEHVARAARTLGLGSANL
jgi:uncharacterized protein